MSDSMIGEPVTIDFMTTDAFTAAVPLTIRAAGSNTTRNLAANERLIIQSIGTVAGGAGIPGVVIVFDDASNAGVVDANERLYVVNLAAATTNPAPTVFYGTDGGNAGGLGRMPSVKAAAAGTFYIMGIGTIVKG